jgi:hypothetical protein
MQSRFRFTFEPDWLTAPMAFWVHVQDPDQPGTYAPPAPCRVANRGFVFLFVEYGPHELVFSSPEQLSHCIAVLSTKPLPSTRTLSAKRGATQGPNSHWLSRLPAELKSPAARFLLVRHLKSVYAMAVTGTRARPGQPKLPPLWPGLTPLSPSAA